MNMTFAVEMALSNHYSLTHHLVLTTDQCARCYGYTSVSPDATPPLSTKDELEARACSSLVDYGGWNTYTYCTRTIHLLYPKIKYGSGTYWYKEKLLNVTSTTRSNWNGSNIMHYNVFLYNSLGIYQDLLHFDWSNLW